MMKPHRNGDGAFFMEQIEEQSEFEFVNMEKDRDERSE